MTTDAPPMTDTLRGRPAMLVTRGASESGSLRDDGTARGPGYFGSLAMRDGLDITSTECAYRLLVKVPKRSHGHLRHIYMRTLVPLLVPTLTREEIAHLVDGGDPTSMIRTKAILHAEARLSQSLSPFAEGWETPIELPKLRARAMMPNEPIVYGSVRA